MENYLIKTSKLVEQKIEVPKYFKIVHMHYMMLNENEVLVVKPLYRPDLFVYPEIRVDLVRYLADFWAKNDFDTLTEDEFKLAYTSASLEIEMLFN
jgi:hypothetical protein